MAVRLERSRSYPVAREDAFRYITDPRNWPDYWPDLIAVVDPENARWRGPGDTMRLRMRLLGRETDLVMTLEGVEPPSSVTYRSVLAGLPDARHERHFEPAAGGFTYRLVVTYAARPRSGRLARSHPRPPRHPPRPAQDLDNIDHRLAR